MMPTLRPDVHVLPFEDGGGERKFIVAVGETHLVVSALVAAVLVESRVPSTPAALAQRVSHRLGVTVSVERVSRVISERLLAVCFRAVEQEPECPIRFRVRVMGAAALRVPLGALSKLFALRTALFVLALLTVAGTALALGTGGRDEETLRGSEVACAVTLTLLGVLAHELGHLAACARFGAKHGGIGVGLYWCMPVFFADVNGAWTLPRLQRAAVDVGGVYFQCIYIVGLGAIYMATAAPAVQEAIAWNVFLTLHTLNPVLKYDGYWLLADLSGTPNLHAQIGASARKVWDVVRGESGASLPTVKPLLLLSAFTGIALAYFVYLLLMLGTGIGRSAGAASDQWATSGAVWQAVGESALLALLLLMAISLASLLAQSIHRIGRISTT